MNAIIGQNTNLLTSTIGVLIGVVIIVGGIIYLKNLKSNKSKADKFLNEMNKDIKKMILDSATLTIEVMKGKQFESVAEFEEAVMKQANGELWLFIENKLDEAVREDLLPLAARNLITREYVDKFIAAFITNDNISSEIRGIYCDNVVKMNSSSMVEEDKKLSDQFSNDDFFDDESDVDNLQPGDLEKDDTEAKYKLVNDNDLEEIKEQEIIPPQDDVDITQDETVTEEVDEDGLTAEERAAGIHFNKAGRKVDARGRFVKLQN